MKSIELFLPSVLPHVQGCPESVALNAIVSAAQRFCNDSWIVRESLPASDVIAGADDYTITASSGNITIGLVSFLYNKLELPKATPEELDVLDSGWRTADPGVPTSVMSPEPDRILLNRKPKDGIVGGMIVTVATKPDSSATFFNDILFNDWLDAIKYGALHELLEIPGKGWSNMKQSLWYGKKFNFEIQRAKARSVMGNMKKSTTAQQRAWI